MTQPTPDKTGGVSNQAEWQDGVPEAGNQTSGPSIARMHLDRLTLRFSQKDAELERPFLDYYSFRSINYTRFALLAATFMIAVFGVLDHFLLPSHT